MTVEKDIAIARNLVAIARRKGKKGNPRSQMLRVIMPHLSQDTGAKLAEAINKNNAKEFEVVWDKVKDEIAEFLHDRKSSHSSTVEEGISPVPFGSFVKEGEKPSTEQMKLSQDAASQGLADGCGEITETPDGTGKYFTKDEARQAARAEYTPEQIEAFQEILDGDFLNDMHKCIIEDLKLNESTSRNFDYHNYSNVLLGPGHSVKIREFIANGAINMTSKTKREFVLRIDKIRTVGNSISPKAVLQNIDIQIDAGLYENNTNKRLVRFVEDGCIAVSATEIVLRALAWTSKN